jgi:large subunit ribosomal protein L13Ae
MFPHKTPSSALGRLKVFEGMPGAKIPKKREVIAGALIAVRLSSFRKFYNLGDLSGEVGWGKGAPVEKLENKRRDGVSLWHKKRV